MLAPNGWTWRKVDMIPVWRDRQQSRLVNEHMLPLTSRQDKRCSSTVINMPPGAEAPSLPHLSWLFWRGPAKVKHWCRGTGYSALPEGPEPIFISLIYMPYRRQLPRNLIQFLPQDLLSQSCTLGGKGSLEMSVLILKFNAEQPCQLHMFPFCYGASSLPR